MLRDLEFANDIYFRYESYLESSLKHRRFKHADVRSLINKLDPEIFKVSTAGKSLDGKEIFSVKAGKGKYKILCWSQMHGDESTATMALFDVMNFLAADDNLNGIRSYILKHLTIHMIPMLNPDGAETFSRRNFSGIDINRDAGRLATPEAKILDNLVKKLKPQFAFNLHDQDTHYTAGKCFKSAAISFLAPPFDQDKSVNHVRMNAIKLISRLFKITSTMIPGHIGRYPDDFEPRAFGDNIQKSGASTILIESGGWADDIEKQFIRKLNFIILLTGFKSIAEGSFKEESPDIYETIPINEIYLFDLLLRNLTFIKDGKISELDIGINSEEYTDKSGTGYFTRAVIDDMGDLSIYYGYIELDLKGYEVSAGRTYKHEFKSPDDIKESDIIKILNEGYTDIIVEEIPDKAEFSSIPLNIIIRGYKYFNAVETGRYANLVIRKDGVVKYLVINGNLISPQKPYENFRQALLL
jgi:hypothetical protein